MSRLGVRVTVILTIIAIAAASTIAARGEMRVEPLKISVSAWIGYAPLFYVREKGWTRDSIRLVPVSSLIESEKLFQAGMTDGFAGTQFEFFQGRIVSASLTPVILINRSNGADGILSNVTIDDLRKNEREATVYLEMQTVNSELFSSFVRQYNLSRVRFRKINRDQAEMANMRPPERPTLVVTYEPYKTALVTNGFREVASTSEISLLVLDAVFVEGAQAARYNRALSSLRSSIARAVHALRDDPAEFYETVRPYLPYANFGDFSAAVNGIEWIDENAGDELMTSIANNGIPLDRLAR